MRLGWAELILILFIVLVLFGGKKLSGMGSVIGKNIKDLKKELKDDDTEDLGKNLSALKETDEE